MTNALSTKIAINPARDEWLIPSMSSAGQSTKAEISVTIKKILAQKLDDSSSHDTRVVFNVGVNIEEIYRRSNSVGLNYAISLETEPAVAKIEIEGMATVTGNPAGVEKMLALDPTTNIPKVLTPIYEEIYSVLFVLFGTLKLPYPSPALLKKPHVGVSKPAN